MSTRGCFWDAVYNHSRQQDSGTRKNNVDETFRQNILAGIYVIYVIVCILVYNN